MSPTPAERPLTVVTVDEFIEEEIVIEGCGCKLPRAKCRLLQLTVPRIFRGQFAGLQFIPPKNNYFFCRETEIFRVNRMNESERKKWLLSDEGKLKKATEAATVGTWKIFLQDHQCKIRPRGTGKILKTRSGNLIPCWAVSDRDPSRVIVISHESGTLISCNYSVFPTLQWIARECEALVVCYDYSGYGISTGTASTEALVADLKAVVEYAKSLAGSIAMEDFFLLGMSIGSYPSIRVATIETFGGIVLLAPPYSAKNVFRSHCRLLGQLVPDSDCNTSAWIGKVKSRILILHGDKDRMVPMSNGLKLHAIAPNSRFFKIPGATHGDILWKGETWQRLYDFIDGDNE